MVRLRQALVAVTLGLTIAGPVLADDEASNVSHVVAGPYGRCYAKSVPRHVYDPGDGSRQQGTTSIYRVDDGEDVLVHVYDWFSQRLFVRCRPGDGIIVVRIGPWQRGHDPRADHLAVAFYRRGVLVRSYSTLDISGPELAAGGGFSRYMNVSASVSHYTVFASGPDFVKVTTSQGNVFTENWQVRATTIDGRSLIFDTETGEAE